VPGADAAVLVLRRPDADCVYVRKRTGYSSKVAKTTRERQQEARQAKLDYVQEQVDSGELVIRTMTGAEKAKWAKQRRRSDARATPAERAGRAAALENRRRRVQRFE
jgi:hypothetical protein